MLRQRNVTSASSKNHLSDEDPSKPSNNLFQHLKAHFLRGTSRASLRIRDTVPVPVRDESPSRDDQIKARSALERRLYLFARHLDTHHSTAYLSPLLHDRRQHDHSRALSDPLGQWFLFHSHIGPCFLLIFIVRLWAAFYLHDPASDCDEVMNYWEPLHFLVTRGASLQTWEYAPWIALRSYSVLLPFKWWAQFVMGWTGSKRIAFFAVRMFMAALSALSESFFIRAVACYIHPSLGRYLLAILLFSAAMMQSSVAFLPNTWSMFFIFIAHALHYKQAYSHMLFTLACMCILAWPFGMLSCLVPIFCVNQVQVTEFESKGKERLHAPKDPLGDVQVQIQYSVQWHLPWRVGQVLTAGLLAILYVLLPSLFIEKAFYGQWQFPSLNLLLYNVIYADSNSGPDVFGTEPWFYYLVNGFLSFNILFILALCCYPLLVLVQHLDATGAIRSWKWLSLDFYIALIVFSLQSHKESRFLFVIYPLIALNAAMALRALRVSLDVFLTRFISIKKVELFTKRLIAFVLLMSALISISRSLALYSYYSQPQWQLYATHKLPNNATLCLGDAWHRFPGHFLLPNGSKIAFLKGKVSRGLLPSLFDFEKGTQTIQGRVNTRNEESVDRYTPLENCDWILDEDVIGKQSKRGTYRAVLCASILVPHQSTLPRRAFYLPFGGKLTFREQCWFHKR